MNTFYFSDEFISMLVRFVILMVFSVFIIHFLYFRKSKRRDFYFTFLLTSVAIFFLVYFMIFCLEDMKGKTSIGIGIGLFGIFSIMRYRTDAMPVREMTYLFTIITMSVVNAVGTAVTLSELLLADILIVAVLWIAESHLKMTPCKSIMYDRIELVRPDRFDELKEDLEKRLGLKIIRVDVGGMDLLRDMAVLKVYYEKPTEETTVDDSIDSKVKLKMSELSDSKQ
jgi:hypothetical protein